MGISVAVLPDVAEHVAHGLLGAMTTRWRHTAGVARRAAELARSLPVDGEVLVAAAWLHDIGYAEATRSTGFHPLDGAMYLTERRWPVRIVGLVAQHSGAEFVAAARGLADALAAYPDDGGLLSDALTYADQTVGPSGERMTPEQRRREMLRRRGPKSWNARVDGVRAPHLRAVADRVERCLAESARLY
jgi:putative nucleotidyltransferase with HDIG domain